MRVQSLGRDDLLEVILSNTLAWRIPWTEYWNGVPFFAPGDLPNPGIKPTFLMSPALAGRSFTTSTTWEAQIIG